MHIFQGIQPWIDLQDPVSPKAKADGVSKGHFQVFLLAKSLGLKQKNRLDKNDL